MIKQLFLISIILLGNCSFAAEYVIKVTPSEKFTTANDKIQEGDETYFKVIKSNYPKIKQGEKISGIVTFYEANGFAGKEAVISIEQFKTNDGVELKGMIYAKGNQHNQLMEFNETTLIPPMWMRGGEVTLIPDKDIFLLYLEK